MPDICPPWPEAPTAGLAFKFWITYHDPIPPDPPRWHTREYAAGAMKHPGANEWGGQMEVHAAHQMWDGSMWGDDPRHYKKYVTEPGHEVFVYHMHEWQRLSVWLEILPGGTTANIAVKLESRGWNERREPPTPYQTRYQTDEIIEWAPLKELQKYYWNLTEYAPELSSCRMEVKIIPPPTKKSW